MAPSATATTTSSTTLHNSRPAFARSLRRPVTTASTPDLSSVYAAQSRLAPPGLSRKASLAALTPSSLASIPDVSESYALDSVLSDSTRTMVPATPGRSAAEDIFVGDAVDVPGGMHGTIRFVGTVQGKKGTFAGVELHPDFAVKGKNNGDVDGYATSTPNLSLGFPGMRLTYGSSTSTAYPTSPPWSQARASFYPLPKLLDDTRPLAHP